MKRIAPALVLAFSFACAHEAASSHVSAKVLTLEPGARNAAGLQPVANAQLGVQCPNGQTSQLGTTDSQGRMSLDVNQAPALDCKLTVAQSNYKTVTYPVSTVCTETTLNACTNIDVSAILQQATTGSAGDSRQ